MTPEELLTKFMASRRAMHLRPNTIGWYDAILPRMVRVLPAEPSTEDLSAWLAFAPSAMTGRNWLRAARAMYRWGADTYGVDNIAARAKPPRLPRKSPRVFTQGELRLIFAAARRFGPREHAAVTTLLDTGVRIGELASLKTERISQESAFDPRTGEQLALIVLTVDGKTGERRVPATGATLAALMAIAPPTGYIFRATKGPDRPLPVASLKDRVRDVVTAAGLTGQKLGPHTFRHTFATNYLRRGGDLYRLQRILGHATIKQTSIYTHLCDGDAFAEHARLSPLLSFFEGSL